MYGIYRDFERILGNKRPFSNGFCRPCGRKAEPSQRVAEGQSETGIRYPQKNIDGNRHFRRLFFRLERFVQMIKNKNRSAWRGFLFLRFKMRVLQDIRPQSPKPRSRNP